MSSNFQASTTVVHRFRFTGSCALLPQAMASAAQDVAMSAACPDQAMDVTVEFAAPALAVAAPVAAPAPAVAAVAPPAAAPVAAPSKAQAQAQAPAPAQAQAPSKAPAPSKAQAQAPAHAPAQAPSKAQAPAQAPSKAQAQAPSKAWAQAPLRSPLTTWNPAAASPAAASEQTGAASGQTGRKKATPKGRKKAPTEAAVVQVVPTELTLAPVPEVDGLQALGECPVFGCTWALYLRGVELEWDAAGNVVALKMGDYPPVHRRRVYAVERGGQKRAFISVESTVNDMQMFRGRHLTEAVGNVSFVVHAVEMYREYERMVQGTETPAVVVLLPVGFDGKTVDVARRGRGAAECLWCTLGSNTLAAPCRASCGFASTRQWLQERKATYDRLVGRFSAPAEEGEVKRARTS